MEVIEMFAIAGAACFALALLCDWLDVGSDFFNYPTLDTLGLLFICTSPDSEPATTGMAGAAPGVRVPDGADNDLDRSSTAGRYPTGCRPLRLVRG